MRHWTVDIPLPAGEWPTEVARTIFTDHLPMWADLFLSKNASYGESGYHEDGIKGYWPEMRRKVARLRRALWEGEDTSNWTEQPDEIIFDLIGTLFMAYDCLTAQTPVAAMGHWDGRLSLDASEILLDAIKVEAEAEESLSAVAAGNHLAERARLPVTHYLITVGEDMVACPAMRIFDVARNGGWRTTTNPAEVTCRSCLRVIASASEAMPVPQTRADEPQDEPGDAGWSQLPSELQAVLRSIQSRRASGQPGIVYVNEVDVLAGYAQDHGDYR